MTSLKIIRRKFPTFHSKFIIFFCRSAFLECYNQEFVKRRDHYLDQKAKKEELFREIEQLKTSKRLIENKLNKSKNSSKISQFPLKIEVGLQKAVINERKEINEKMARLEELGILFKVDNGKEYFDSIVVKNLHDPTWTNSFQLSVMNESELIFFQLVLDDKLSDTQRVLDSFDIRANEIAAGLQSQKSYQETIITNNGNEYELFVKKKGDEQSKLKIIERKIEKKHATYVRLNQIHTIAKEAMENLISKKGMELIKEWGFMNRKNKILQESKAKIMKDEERKAKTPKVATTAKANNSFSMKAKTPKAGFLGLKADSSKFKKALEECKKEEANQKVCFFYL